jgi:hypothetical protein
MLEPDYEEPYAAWKKDPTPDANAAILKTLDPVIEGAMRVHVGQPNPLLKSRASLMTLDALKTYDPARGRLQTHLYNQLLGLKRVNRKQTSILAVPERIALERQQLEEAASSLRAELGREPVDAELADRTGFSMARMGRVRSYRPAVSEGAIEASAPAGFSGGVRPAAPPPSIWPEIVYDELDAYHRKVMEYGLGLHGRRPISNAEIAVRLGRSPGAISQAKLRIQKLLDQEHELSGMI